MQWLNDYGPDSSAFALSAAVIAAYYYFPRRKIGQDPTCTIHRVNELARSLSVIHVMNNLAKDGMAVRTLRNFAMSVRLATFWLVVVLYRLDRSDPSAMS